MTTKLKQVMSTGSSKEEENFFLEFYRDFSKRMEGTNDSQLLTQIYHIANDILSKIDLSDHEIEGETNISMLMDAKIIQSNDPEIIVSYGVSNVSFFIFYYFFLFFYFYFFIFIFLFFFLFLKQKEKKRQLFFKLYIR